MGYPQDGAQVGSSTLSLLLGQENLLSVCEPPGERRRVFTPRVQVAGSIRNSFWATYESRYCIDPMPQIRALTLSETNS